MKSLIKKGKDILLAPQESILSAASIIMVMGIAGKFLGLLRQRTLTGFFPTDELSLFFAAFRLPDTVFEVLTLGTLSSAFIPVFSRLLRDNEKKAWDTAGRMINVGLLVFAVFAFLFGAFAFPLYKILAPGFNQDEISQIAYLARVLFAAQGFFVVSYALTGVLESSRRFLIPALAPLFYNLGIILGTIFLYPELDLLAPALGAVFGAAAHFLIQLPLSYRLGLRFSPAVKPTREIKKIGKLAAPRMGELGFLQISKTTELYLASLISTSSYAFYTLAYSIQFIPISLFGVSLAKAALPTLSRRSDEPEKFKATFVSTLNQMMFFLLPMATVFIVLRIPIVRLILGSNKFDWPDTVQTGLVLSAFALGIPFYGATMLLNRAFYAQHDTKTPVIVSLCSTGIIIVSGFLLILGFSLPTWGLAAAFSLGFAFQSAALFLILSKKINGGVFFGLSPIFKSFIASIVSGVGMFVILKFFDRSVWIKRLSFVSNIELTQNLDFEKFVIDTRYSVNLLILTFLTGIIGAAVYLFVSWILGSEELKAFWSVLLRRKKTKIPQDTVLDSV